MKQSSIFLIFSSVIFVFSSCESNQKSSEEISANDKDTIILDTLEIQKKFHPEAPEHFVYDTTLKIGNTRYTVHTEDMTIENSFISFMDDFQNNKVMNIYMDRMFIVNIKKGSNNLFTDTIKKENYTSEYVDDFIGKTILHDMAFQYFDEDANEFVFNFNLSKPDTDYSDQFIYKVSKTGKASHEINELD